MLSLLHSLTLCYTLSMRLNLLESFEVPPRLHQGHTEHGSWRVPPLGFASAANWDHLCGHQVADLHGQSDTGGANTDFHPSLPSPLLSPPTEQHPGGEGRLEPPHVGRQLHQKQVGDAEGAPSQPLHSRGHHRVPSPCSGSPNSWKGAVQLPT